jgi:hypothetical protein
MKPIKLFYLNLFCLCLICAVVEARATDVLDERVQLVRSGTCSTNTGITFAGQSAIIDGSTIKSTSGAALLVHSERILDATSFERTDFILGETTIRVRQGKRIQDLPLIESATRGRLLFARPDFLIYYITTNAQTLFFTQTPQLKRLYFAVGGNFVTSRLDKFGNTLIAFNDRLLAVNKRGQAVPLVVLKNETITSMELLSKDNGILLATQHGLFKFAYNKKLYSVLDSSGHLEAVEGQFFWCESDAARYSIAGLENVGLFESDKAYVKTLLTQGNKLYRLGLMDKALAKYAKVLEIMPNEAEARRLVILVGRKVAVNRSSK